MSEHTQIKSQVDEEQNPSGAQSESPLPAQVEGLATARPWKTGTTGDGDLWIEGVDPRANVIADIVTRKEGTLTEEDEANAELIITAVNEYEDNKAKVERLEVALTHLLPRFDITADGECKFCGRNYGKEIPRDYLCANVDCDAFIARAALIESPETKEN